MGYLREEGDEVLDDLPPERFGKFAPDGFGF
jgi:hypothetical protein